MAPEASLTTPEGVGTMFCNALEDPDQYFNALRNLTTPESWDDWGDFREAHEAFKAIPNVGYSNRAQPAVGADDVAYFKIFSDVDQSYEIVDPQIVDVAVILSMVWRPELGSWRVHAAGDYIRPEDLPRSAG